MKQLYIREICIIPGHRGVQIKRQQVPDKDAAYALGQALANNRMCLVDLIDNKGRILKRFSAWAL